MPLLDYTSFLIYVSDVNHFSSYFFLFFFFISIWTCFFSNLLIRVVIPVVGCIQFLWIVNITDSSFDVYLTSTYVPLPFSVIFHLNWPANMFNLMTWTIFKYFYLCTQILQLVQSLYPHKHSFLNFDHCGI